MTYQTKSVWRLGDLSRNEITSRRIVSDPLLQLSMYEQTRHWMD
ncbi:hypothetical protein [Acetobacter nitrogenifigens]|nr:hypothetical protein [Acetobacter nitrogenifigens]